MTGGIYASWYARCGTSVCILSTPGRACSLRQNIVNPYHVREYSEAELLELLKTFFGQVDLFHQGFSSRYHEQVSSYAASIQTQKQKSPVLQFEESRAVIV